MLVTMEIFQCFGARSILYLSTWHACLKVWQPL